MRITNPIHIILPVFILLSLLYSTSIFSQSSAPENQTYYIKVHFLYGSRPLSKYRETERKWFGGVLGGHVGIEVDSGHILSFRPSGNFHLFTSNRNKHSRFDVHSESAFYSWFRSNPDSVKKAVVIIPITKTQKQKLDSIDSSYLKQTPYDYALVGMRCGAAAYEILGQLGIMENYTYQKTYWKIFYPQKLRKRLLEKADKNHWSIERQDGTTKRKWEKH